MAAWTCMNCGKMDYRTSRPDSVGCPDSKSRNHAWKEVPNNKRSVTCIKCGKLYAGASPPRNGCPDTKSGNHVWM